MTKQDLVTRISRETGLVQPQVVEIVQKILDHITESLAQGENVELQHFGTFFLKCHKARIGRNPRKPQNIFPIPTRVVARFRASPKLRAAALANHPG